MNKYIHNCFKINYERLWSLIQSPNNRGIDMAAIPKNGYALVDS